MTDRTGTVVAVGWSSTTGSQPARITIEDGRIAAVELDDGAEPPTARIIAPGFVDVHVHGWGGHDAMGDRGRPRRHGPRACCAAGVTSFLPTAVTAPLDDARRLRRSVRDWLPDAPADGAEPLGFNLEGPFLARARRGAHDPAHLQVPAEVLARDARAAPRRTRG